MGMAMAAAGVAKLVQGQGYQPAFRPDLLTDRPAGPANEVLVLGTPHLSQLPATFRPAMVEPLIDRLARWHPTAIATENISGLQCHAMRQGGDLFREAVRTYCPDPRAAGQVAGMDVPAAASAAERLLADWPAAPSPAQRRRLALLFLAAGEPVSALVQWLRLPPGERRADTSLTPGLVAEFQARAGRNSEDNLLAAQLAARVGLDRTWSVDDQSPVGAAVLDEDAYGAAVTRAWDNPATRAEVAETKALFARLDRPDGLLALYRALNAPAYAARKYRSDWGAALAEPSPQGYGRLYVAYWETRNLRMVANIRAVLAHRPGTRLIAIVGAAHKGYYEAYLRQMRDVTLVDVAPLLR